MASLTDVFTVSERTNWLKAWLAIDIAKCGLEQFVENEAKILHDNIYNHLQTSGAVPCSSCHTANLLKCPSQGICNKRGANSLCKAMHDTAFKQPRPCPSNVCNKILVEIAKQHKFVNPSWKNTLANHWATNPWQIAKVYLPPDGYTEKCSVQDTDFNGIINFMINCKHFDNKFSFPIDPGKTHPLCLLTKAREIVKTVRHSSTCKVTDKDLQDIFVTLSSLLTDSKCLVHDLAAQEAVSKLGKLQTDVLKLTTEEIVDLLEAAQDKLKKVENITKTAIDEMRIYIENCRKDLKEQTDKCKQELSEHTGKCKQELEDHCRKSTESNYEQSCKDFLRRLRALYNATFCHVPLSNLDQSFDKRITDVYATPKINRIELDSDGKRIEREEALTYKHIFYTDDKSNRRIYLQGEPGSGKSTFSAKLVFDWTNGNQVSSASPIETTAFDDVLTITPFKFLFCITLRDSRGQKDVTQMIKNQLIDKMFSEDERENVYKLFVQIMNIEICLVVREGLDEWVPPDGSNLAEPSMAGFQNETCTVLTTSRPWKLADERIKNSQIDRLLEIKGISNSDAFSKKILRCIIDQTNDLEETAIKFKSFVKKHKLISLSSSPMLFTLVICTWVNDIDRSEHLKGSSLCLLYTTLIDSLCKKANSATGYFNDSNPPPVLCFSSTSFIQPNITLLDKLAEVACKLLFSSERETSIVFSDITLSNYFSPDEFTVCKTFALSAGILTNRKNKSRTGSSFSFVHKTVQELLAAYHIACNPYVIEDVISRYLERNNESYLELSQVFIFVCGMNISAANELSALMNQYDLTHCEVEDVWCLKGPCEFQCIIESGIREAVANNQDDIHLKLSHFYIDDSKFRDVTNIWSAITSNVQYLKIESFPEHGKPKPRFERDLSSCHRLKVLRLSGEIWLRDTVNTGTSDLPPVWIALYSADTCQWADPPSAMSSIERIHLFAVTCSSILLRSLFSTLLTLDHWVQCELSECYITSCLDGSCTITCATITTDLNNELSIYDSSDEIPCLLEALHGLNIKSLSLGDLYNECELTDVESLSQCLSSLKQLETVSIRVDKVSSRLWEALSGLKIKSLSLVNYDKELIGKHIESLSHCLSSLTHLETLNISKYEDRPGLLEALRGLNIKSLSLRCPFEGLTVNHVESQCLSSLTQLETLSITGREDSPSLWEALLGLNIKSLSLGDESEYSKSEYLKVNHKELSSKSLSSLTHLETLTMFVYTYIDIQLPQSFKYLNINCEELHASELRDLLNKMIACTRRVEGRLAFGCFQHTPLEEYIDIVHEHDKLKSVIVKRLRIYDRIPGCSNMYCLRYSGAVHDDDSVANDRIPGFGNVYDMRERRVDEDSVDKKEYVKSLSRKFIDHNFEVRLEINPALIS